MIRCLNKKQALWGRVLKRTKTTDTARIPSRAAILSGLADGEEFDLLIIGAGATGSGEQIQRHLSNMMSHLHILKCVSLQVRL
jgi:hypothetical protein